jgi:hypothetical protein
MTKRPDGVTTIALTDTADDDAASVPLVNGRYHEMRVGVAILCFWWALWTLADRVLIRFSPWSEIGAMAVGAVIYFWQHGCDLFFKSLNYLTLYVQQQLQRI